MATRRRPSNGFLNTNYMLTSEPIISVRLAIPDSPIMAPLFPSNNRWASGLLCRLLRNRIEGAGITVKKSDWAFPFNRSFYLFTVAEKPAGRALAAVQEELAAVGLSAWAQIAWHDWNELIWRLYYPKSGIFAAPAPEEFEAEARVAFEGNEAMRKLQERYGISGA